MQFLFQRGFRGIKAYVWLLLLAAAGSAQVDPSQFSAIRWRLIGPFRAGRVTSVAGIAGQPNIYYFGTPGGGVWKTTDSGRVWRPIFDSQPISAIGSIAIAPSHPEILYVGTGENTPGNGVYRSTDSGATWGHAGLDDTRFIQSIVVDPRNPNILVAGANSMGLAMLWRPVAKDVYTTSRGIFKTTNGGKTWKNVLTRKDSIGVVDLCADPGNPRMLYASFYKPASGFGDTEVKATSEIFRSTDQGSSWQPLAGQGLPEKDRGRVGIAVAPGNRGRRLYAILDQGFYRSDDGGATWAQSTHDPRVIGSEYFSRVFVDPQNPDVLYVSQTSLYRSIDGGHTFEPYVGAPSGDDFHVLWIDPRDSKRMLLGVDQGAIVTVDGGATWGSWYNQPTGEFYHVSTDNTFPYRVYGAQQDSGTASVASRSDYGEITAREFESIGGFEACFIAPDPLNPNLVYSVGWYGTVVRFDRTTGQLATLFERGERYREAGMAPLAFSPLDPHTLYLGTQYVMSTSDGGTHWKEISPDLTGWVDKDPDAKRNPDEPPPPAITALALSTLETGIVWAGSSNRVIQVTQDGGASWRDVSISGLADNTRIFAIEASHRNPAAAYVVVGGNRETVPPYIAKTADFGHTWQTIVTGLPPGGMVRVVREDPVRPGLLYAGTDGGVFVSFDDGGHWQPLRLNMPVVSITDLDVHGNDLVASTYGRSLWILDDVTPLRAAGTESVLLPPAPAIRVRWDNFQDTPYPPETPAGQNPPDGAVIDYLLKTAPSGEITLTIKDAQGSVVRQISSQPKSLDLPPANVPDYWFAPPEALTKSAGHNRFVWDLRYPAPKPLPFGYYGALMDYTEYTLADHAIPGNTPREQPPGPLVVPGVYTVELAVDGQTVRQPLTVKLDPRLQTSNDDLREQLNLEFHIGRGMASSYAAFQQVAALRKAIGENKEMLAALGKKLDEIDQGTRTKPGLGPINRDLSRLASSVQSADVRPADTARSLADEKCQALDAALVKWRELNQKELPSFKSLPVVDVGTGCR